MQPGPFTRLETEVKQTTGQLETKIATCIKPSPVTDVLKKTFIPVNF